jgi:glycerol-3-phosphate dehydrogenase
VFPDLNLATSDIEMHYAGVRPLPFSDASTPGAVSRRHWLEPNPNCEVPFFSIIGGKLTTCRSLAEESAGAILERLGLPRTASSRERPIPDSTFSTLAPHGGENRPASSAESVLAGTEISVSAVRRIIREQWVTKLGDLVERRLMLLYHPQLQREALHQLAELLVEADLLNAAEKTAAVDAVVDRLTTHFGKRVMP